MTPCFHKTARPETHYIGLQPMAPHDARYPHRDVMPRAVFQFWKDRK